MSSTPPVPSRVNFRTPVRRIVYDSDFDESVWGVEIAMVKAAIAAAEPRGIWANLCAGDGRYNNLLLETAERVHAVDLDADALARLVRRSRPEQRSKIVPVICDVIGGLLFSDNAVDGVLLSGSLHLFSPWHVTAICQDIMRVLRPGGTAIVDFCYGIQRLREDGTLLRYPGEHAYSEAEALQICLESWGCQPFRICTMQTPLMSVRLGEVAYTYSSRALVVTVCKPSEADGVVQGW